MGQNMVTFTLESDCDIALKELLKTDDGRCLIFGWTARSIEAAEPSDLLIRPVLFRDYIMEGFVTYSVQAEDLAPGCRLRVDGEGSNRDWSIRPQVRHYIKAAGLVITDEDSAGDSVAH